MVLPARLVLLLLTGLLATSRRVLADLFTGPGPEAGIPKFTDAFLDEPETSPESSQSPEFSLHLHRSVRSVDGAAGGAPQPLPGAAQPRAYGRDVRPAYESGGQGGGGSSLGKLLGQFLPNTYYSRPKFRYPYYDRNGQGYLLYGYGGKELYEYSVFKPLEGYF